MRATKNPAISTQCKGVSVDEQTKLLFQQMLNVKELPDELIENYNKLKVVYDRFGIRILAVLPIIAALSGCVDLDLSGLNLPTCQNVVDNTVKDEISETDKDGDGGSNEPTGGDAAKSDKPKTPTPPPPQKNTPKAGGKGTKKGK